MTRRLLRSLVVLVLAMGTASIGVPAARAEPAPDSGRKEIPLDPRSVQVAIDLTRTSRQLEDATRQLAAISVRTESAQTALDLTDGFIASNRERIAGLRASVASAARTAYLRHVANSASLSVAHVEELDRGSRYASALTRIDHNELDDLQRIEDSLERVRSARASTRDELQASAAKLSDLQGQLSVLQAEQQRKLKEWGAVPVMGDAWLTGDELATWYRSTGGVPKLAAGTTIDDLARMYIEEGAAEHVRGDIAFAQGVIESAYFSVAAGNNYSGIGACDSCHGGFGFASPRDGVRAQIQLLRNYADPDSRAENLTYAPVKGLYPDDPVAASRVFNSFFLKGKVPLWNMMGNGNWATDPTYARKVIALFARIVASIARS